jgi:hypothetical protein
MLEKECSTSLQIHLDFIDHSEQAPIEYSKMLWHSAMHLLPYVSPSQPHTGSYSRVHTQSFDSMARQSFFVQEKQNPAPTKTKNIIFFILNLLFTHTIPFTFIHGVKWHNALTASPNKLFTLLLKPIIVILWEGRITWPYFGV